MSARFLNTLDVHVDQLERYPDALRDIYDEKIDVLYIREAYSRETMQAICERLDRNEAAMQVSRMEEDNEQLKQMLIYGVSITPNNIFKFGPPLDDYLNAAVKFRSACRDLFAGHPDYETRVTELFRVASGGRDVQVPYTAEGRHYTPSTVRYIPDGCQIPIHVGNYFLHQPVSKPLLDLLDTRVQISFFIPIAMPGSGGELYVYDLLYEDERTPRDDIDNVDVPTLDREFKRETHVPGIGDLFIFNGGKYYHRVTHVKSAPQERRWTIGGFLAFAKDARSIYFYG